MMGLASLWESVATALPERVLFVSRDTQITAREIVAAINLNIDRVGGTQGPVFLATQSAAAFLVGMLVCAKLGRELVCPAHLGAAYLHEIGVDDGVLLTDNATKLPQARRMRMAPESTPSATMPSAPDASLKITFFTSGSTGTPKAVERTLDQMETEVQVLESLWGGAPGPVWGSVSHQHIYGLGFRIIWPIMAGRPTADGQVNFWEELRDQLVPGSMFISSPAHLTRLPDASVLSWCQPHMNFSAGGLLPFEAARECAAFFGNLPIEVFGSTETSAVAWRQQHSSSELWKPLPGVQITTDEAGRLAVRSPFIGEHEEITMGDRIEIVERDRFRLLGRADRVVNVEGRRVSLTRVEEALGDLEEVREVAVIALPHHRDSLGAAIVLAPSGAALLSRNGAFRLSRRLRGALAERLDPMERPKFWRFVEHLPLNSQGKRLETDLRALFENSAEEEPDPPAVRRLEDQFAEIDIRLDPDMVWFGGHFPIEPIFPGVAEVHFAVCWARKVWNWSPSTATLTRVKFHKILRPGDEIRLILTRDTARDRLKFRIERDDGIAGEGIVGGGA